MSEFARTLESWKGCDPKAMAGMSSAAIQYALSDAKHDIVKLHDDFDRVTAERDAALASLDSADASAQTLHEVIARLQQRLTAADERADVLEGLLRLLAELPGVRTSGMWERVVVALKTAECDHSYHHFGTEQPRRRCNLCNKLEPAEGGRLARRRGADGCLPRHSATPSSLTPTPYMPAAPRQGALPCLALKKSKDGTWLMS